MHNLAAVPGIPWMGLAFSVPMVVALLWSSIRFASTPEQRIANLLVGSFCAALAMGLLNLVFVPRPNSWAENHFVFFSFGVAPIGAVLGVTVAVLVRRKTAALKTRRHDH